MGRSKTILGGERTLILRVLKFFENEKLNGKITIPLNRAVQRTCAATGVSRRTIMRIKDEYFKLVETTTGHTPTNLGVAKKLNPEEESLKDQKLNNDFNTVGQNNGIIAENVNTNKIDICYETKRPRRRTMHSLDGKVNYLDVRLSSPGKNAAKRGRKPIEVDDSTIHALENIVKNIYTQKNEKPTVKKILEVAKAELNFPGQRDTLRKILHEKLGYKFKSFKNKKAQHVEQAEHTEPQRQEPRDLLAHDIMRNSLRDQVRDPIRDNLLEPLRDPLREQQREIPTSDYARMVKCEGQYYGGVVMAIETNQNHHLAPPGPSTGWHPY